MTFEEWQDTVTASWRATMSEYRAAYEAGRAAGIEEAAATVEKPGYVKINGINYALTYVIGAVENYVHPAGAAASIAELEAAVARKDEALRRIITEIPDLRGYIADIKGIARAALEEPK